MFYRVQRFPKNPKDYVSSTDPLSDLPLAITATAFGAVIKADGHLVGDQADLAIEVSFDDLAAIKDRFGIAVATNSLLEIAGRLQASPSRIQFSEFTIRLGTPTSAALSPRLGSGSRS